MKSLSHYVNRLKSDGPLEIFQRRMSWYGGVVSRAFRDVRYDLAGRVVEASGGVVKLDHLRFNTSSPLISRHQRGEIWFGGHEREERQFVSLVYRASSLGAAWALSLV